MKQSGAILHATDLSKASDRAFRTAVELARADRSELLLLHVQVPPGSFTASEPPPDYLAFLAQARAATARRLAAVLARARKRGVHARAMLAEGVQLNRSCGPHGGATLG
jgi:nucleotide-binding universal stress UspA family protein